MTTIEMYRDCVKYNGIEWVREQLSSMSIEDMFELFLCSIKGTPEDEDERRAMGLD